MFCFNFTQFNMNRRITHAFIELLYNHNTAVTNHISNKVMHEAILLHLLFLTKMEDQSLSRLRNQGSQHRGSALNFVGFQQLFSQYAMLQDWRNNSLFHPFPIYDHGY